MAYHRWRSTFPMTRYRQGRMHVHISFFRESCFAACISGLNAGTHPWAGAGWLEVTECVPMPKLLSRTHWLALVCWFRWLAPVGQEAPVWKVSCEQFIPTYTWVQLQLKDWTRCKFELLFANFGAVSESLKNVTIKKKMCFCCEHPLIGTHRHQNSHNTYPG